MMASLGYGGNGTQKSAGQPWVLLAAATVAQAAASFCMLGLAVVAAFLQQDLYLTSAQVGLVIGASGAASIVALPIVGNLLDRRSERLIVGVGAAIMAAGIVLAAFAPSLGAILGSLLIVGIGYSTAQPGGSKFVSRSFQGRHLGLAMGIRQAGLPLGGAAAAALLPYVATAYGWRTAFVLTAAVVLAGGVVFAILCRNAVDEVVSPAQAQLRYMWTLVRQEWMRRILWSGAALVGAQYAFLPFFMLFLHDDHGIPLVSAGWILFVAQLAGMCGRVVLAACSDRGGGKRYRFVSLSMTAAAAGMIVLALLPGDTPVGVLMVVAAWFGFFGLGWYGPWVAHLADAAPAGKVGLAMGAAMACNQLFIVGIPPAMGLLHDLAGGYSTIWWTVGAFLAATTWWTTRSADRGS